MTDASNSKSFVLAIDGPAGAGKSTVARHVAERFGWRLVDTGALYRAVALLAEERGLTAESDIVAAIRSSSIRLADHGVFLDGRDVSRAIRTPPISTRASQVSALAGVRGELLDLQRQNALTTPNGAVLEGRDIGTVVFPDADLKIFLTASLEERARRRAEELAQAGRFQPYEEVLDEMRTRDDRDAQRQVAPLQAAPDSLRIDTSGRLLESIVDEIVEAIEQRLASRAEGAVGRPNG